jgi:hypothetical protein
MWILKEKYDYWWKKYGIEKTDRATKTSLFDKNWAISLKQGEEVAHIAWFSEPCYKGRVL